MTDYSIRQASLHDLDTLMGFNQAMARETEDVALDRDTVCAGVRALLDDETKGRYFVACQHDKVAGQIMYTREWSDWRNADFWWIQSVYVMPEHRRRGVFRALFEHVRTQAMARDDVCGLRLYVERDNAVAQDTYLKLSGKHSDYRMMEWPISRRSR